MGVASSFKNGFVWVKKLDIPPNKQQCPALYVRSLLVKTIVGVSSNSLRPTRFKMCLNGKK